MGSSHFIYLGYDKSGSTWFFNAIKNHPEVSVAASKETFFFDRYYDKGMDWYQGFFDTSKAVTLDISHDYIFDLEALNKIKKDIPSVKCLVFIRNPIDKAWSLFKFAKRNGQVVGELKEAVIDKPGIIRRSFYANNIEQAKLIFGDSLQIFYFDELEENPVGFFEKVTNFIGVEPTTSIDLNKKINAAAKTRFKFIAPIMKPTVVALRVIGANKLIGFLKTNNLFHTLLFKENNVELSREEHEFLANTFKKDIDELSVLLNKDFTHWLKYGE